MESEKEVRLKQNPYVMAFIAKEGGAKTVQHKVDLHYAALLNLEKGKRFGNPETFKKFADVYEDFDIVHASTGQPGKPEKSPSHPSDPGGIEWEKKFTNLEGKYEKLRQEYQIVLKRLVERDHPELFRELEGVKMPSGSRVTVKEIVEEQQRESETNQLPQERELMGFKIPVTVRPQAKVLPMYPETKVVAMQA